MQKADKTLIRDCSWLPGGFHTAKAALVLAVLLCWKEEAQGGGLVAPDCMGGRVMAEGNTAGEDEFGGDDKVRNAG